MVPNCVYSLLLECVGDVEFSPAWQIGVMLSSLVTWAASIVTCVLSHDYHSACAYHFGVTLSVLT